MSGIQQFISNRLPQRCVYWGNPVEDGYGSKIFDAPIELPCRWEDMQQVIVETDGTQSLSRAVVFVDVDLDEDGLLWLGTLNDLVNFESAWDSLGDVDHSLIPKLHIIKRWEKSPALNSTTQFLRKAHLTPYLT